MQSHFSSIPSDWYRKNNIAEYEGFYASVFYSYFASLGLDIVVEDATNHGKIDMTVKMPNAIYIFEFKVTDIVKEHGSALDQIKQKDYAGKYKNMGLPVYITGIEFDKEKRNVVRFEWELFKS
jgi:hypothetical protein